jgi:hypothetical protein
MMKDHILKLERILLDRLAEALNCGLDAEEARSDLREFYEWVL